MEIRNFEVSPTPRATVGVWGEGQGKKIPHEKGRSTPAKKKRKNSTALRKVEVEKIGTNLLIKCSGKGGKETA